MMRTVGHIFAGLLFLFAANRSNAGDIAGTNTITPSPTRTQDGVEFVIGPVYAAAPELPSGPVFLKGPCTSSS